MFQNYQMKWGYKLKTTTKFLFIALFLILPVLLSGCFTSNDISSTGEQGKDIISAEEAKQLLSEEGVVLVDAQKSSVYKKGHLVGAVNISRGDIVVLGPFPNMLAPKEKVEKVLGDRGIMNDTLVIIYDDNSNMDSARLWWTLKVYGHEKMKVVSGGRKALLKAGVKEETQIPKITPVKYMAKEKNTDYIALVTDVKAQVDNPDPGVVILDTRSQAEYDLGTIPGAVLIDFNSNNYKDGTYRSIQNIKIIYKEADIEPDQTVIMYCKSSIRAAQTFLALHNAGYRKLKVYDGAWLEWSADTSLPVQLPSNNQIESNFQDAS